MKKQTIEAVICGAHVEIKMAKFRAMITAQCIRFGKITYEVTYFANGEQKVCWLHREEFDIYGSVKDHTQKIGFNKT